MENTDLHRAIREGKKDEFLALMAQGVDIESTYESGRTLLHYAAHHGANEFVALLLENGADHSLQETDGSYAIHHVARRGDGPTIRRLVQAGADVNAADNVQKTPLHWATRYGNSETAESLIRAQAKVNLADKDGKTPFHYVAENNLVTIATYLIKLQADVKTADEYGKGPLHYAATYGYRSLIRLLIEAGAEIDLPDQDYKTPLHYAAQKFGNVKTVQQLIDLGAGINKVDKDEMTPLHYAVANGHDATAEKLLKAQVEVHVQDRDKKTPLHYAAQFCLGTTVQKLIKAGLDVDAYDEDHKTALHYAVMQDDKAVIRHLVKAGANVNAIDKDGKTPLHHATTQDSSAVDDLVEAGANMNAVDKDGKTSLQYYAESQEARLIRCLSSSRRDSFRLGEAMSILKEPQFKIRITDEIMKAAAGSYMGEDVIRLLLRERGDEVKITEEIVKAAAGNEYCGKYLIRLLLRERGDEVKITEEIVKAVVKNEKYGDSMIDCLLLERGDKVKITEEIVKAAAGNENCGLDVIDCLLRERGDEVKVTEEIMEAALGNKKSGEKIIALLNEWRGEESENTEVVEKAGARGDSAKVMDEQALEEQQRPGTLEPPKFSEIPYVVTFVDTIYRLGARLGIFEAPVKPGCLRLQWRCKCGRRFQQDVHHNIADLEFLRGMVEDIVPRAKEQSRRGNLWRPNSVDGAYIKSSTKSGGAMAQTSNTGSAHQDESSSSGLVSNVVEIAKGNDQDTREQNTLRQRKPQSENNNGKDKVEEGHCKWIIVCLPGKSHKTPKSLEHIRMNELGHDLDFFRQIRTLYKRRSNKWRRWLELHDVHQIHLVKFHLRCLKKWVGDDPNHGGIPSKAKEYVPPNPIDHPDWECTAQDIGIDSLPEFMMLLWHMAGEACDDDRAPWYHRWTRLLRRAPDQESQPGLPMYESQLSRDPETRGWRNNIRSIRISIPTTVWSFPLSNFLASFRSRRQMAGSDSHTTPRSEPELSDIGVEIELNPGGFHVYEEVPKKIRKHLELNGTEVNGWGLWVEEDFIIPWYSLVILNLLPIVALVVGVFESSKYGLTWLSVSAYGVSLSTFVFAQWVAKAKDSKR